jgi:tetratricopeptide (TPR) repeat protein
MLAREGKLTTDQSFSQLPQLSQDDSVANPGETVGHYRLLREIGRGGMGSVWLAERADGHFKRQVALKLPRLAWGSGLAERMAREREISALLEHPAIARLYDAGVDERGRPYLAFEYIDGQPIDAWCASQSLGVRQRLALFLQVVRAVAYAHGRLVVHRDLKPSNVLVTADGNAHLLDFGIAKLLQEAAQGQAHLTQELGRVLTPHYASPEQIAGEPVTVASDIYSLGVLLYELLTGALPFAPRRSTLGAIEDAILEGGTVPASARVHDKATARALRGELDAILAKAMQRDPQRRYGTAEALALDIERHLAGETVSARPDSMGYRLRKALRRHWVGVAATGAVLAAVIGGSAVALIQSHKAERSTERERVVREFVTDMFRLNGRTSVASAGTRAASPMNLLESGAQVIEQRFRGQPDMQAELFGVVGAVFSDMGAYKLAADYCARQIEALGLIGADRIEQARATLALAQALFDANRYSEAGLRIQRVLDLANGDRALRLNALVLLARLQLAQEHLDPAKTTAQELATQASGADTPATVKAWSVFIQASVLERQNHFDQALPLYKEAIDHALVAEGPLSTTAIAMELASSTRMIQHENLGIAREYFGNAEKALRQLGGVHAVRANLAAAQFASQLSPTIGAKEAIRLIAREREALLASALPIPDWYIPQLDNRTAFIMIGYGNVAEGLPLFESSYQLLRDSLGPDPQRRQTALTLGNAMMTAGRHDAADRLLREALGLTIAAGQGLHPYTAVEYSVISTNLRMAGRYADAGKFLDSAPHFEPLRGGGPGYYLKLLTWERISLALDQKDASEAMRLLKANPPNPGDNEEIAEFNGAMGEALCLDHQASRGLPLMKSAMAALEATIQLYEGNPDVAQGWAQVGLCALEAGDRAAAMRYAAKARKAFAIQPGVSQYYKNPSQQLDRLLGVGAATPRG